jgi:hypothetical protein
MRRQLCLLLGGFIFAITAPDTLGAAKPAGFVMQPATAVDFEPQIIPGGTRAKPAQWPATFVFRNPQGDQCTGTVVGSRVVITAAHCVEDQAQGIVQLGGSDIATTCTRHPGYQDVPSSDPAWEQKVSPDFALCALVSDLHIADGFEVIGSPRNIPAKDDSVTLLGFGCIKEHGVDQSFGVLYRGETKVVTAPAPPSFYISTQGGAALCFGDSGGGAYRFLNAAETRRLLIAINSRSDIVSTSRLASTGLPGFAEWATAWASSNHVKICGLHPDAKGCRPR